MRINQLILADGNWHTIVVERSGNRVILTVDSKASSEGNIPGSNVLVNLYQNDLFVGGEVSVASDDVFKGYMGCLRNMKIEGILLPLENNNAIGTVKKLHNVDFHCPDIYIPGDITKFYGFFY